MERIGFDYDVKAELEITGADLRVLWKAAEHHYDTKCVEMTRQGGLLFGIRNFMCPDWDMFVQFLDQLNAGKRDADTVKRVLTWRELDTLKKVCENIVVLNKNADKDILSKCFMAFGQTMAAMSKEYKRLTETPVKVEDGARLPPPTPHTSSPSQGGI